MNNLLIMIAVAFHKKKLKKKRKKMLSVFEVHIPFIKCTYFEHKLNHK